MLPLLSAAALAASLAVPPPGDAPDFAELGREFLASHGKVEQASELPLPTLRSAWCVHLGLGAFDVAFPTEFIVEKKHAEQLRLLATRLLDMEEVWIRWMCPDAERVKAAKADLDTLRSWIKGWKPPALAKVAKEEDKDLYVALKAKEDETQARDRLKALLCSPEALGVAPREGEPVRILFAPTRREFVELIGYMGLLEPEKRTEHWVADSTQWTTFWIDWDVVIALEYPPWSPDPKFRTGLPMDKFSKTGLEEHALLQAANALQWLCYGEDGAAYLHQAVAMNLAIAVCGELNALEGDGWGYGTTGGKTQPYERFVPGGNSAGGVLPPIPAASQDTLKKGRWREGLGEDYFAAPLRKGQKEGAKHVAKEGPENLSAAIRDDKNAHFRLVAPDESAKYVVSAPFFGPASKLKPYPPTAVILDYREFFRAYKCAFTHWLQTESDPKDREGCATRFRELMARLHEDGGEAGIEAVAAEIYGLPLSAENGETDSLEWRFLAWLGKGG